MTRHYFLRGAAPNRLPSIYEKPSGHFSVWGQLLPLWRWYWTASCGSSREVCAFCWDCATLSRWQLHKAVSHWAMCCYVRTRYDRRSCQNLHDSNYCTQVCMLVVANAFPDTTKTRWPWKLPILFRSS